MFIHNNKGSASANFAYISACIAAMVFLLVAVAVPQKGHAASAINGSPASIVESYRYQSYWSEGFIHTAGNTKGANLAAFELNNDWRSQQWFEERTADGYVQIRNFWSGLFLADAKGNAFGKAELHDRNSGASILWKKEFDQSRGAFAFQNKATGLYLNVAENRNGSSLIMVPFNASWDGIFFTRQVNESDIQAREIPGPSIDVVAANPPVASMPEPMQPNLPEESPSRAEVKRYQNVWTKKYLHANRDENFSLTSAIDKVDAWESMQWIDVPVSGSTVRLENKWTGYFLADTTGVEWAEVNTVISDPSDKTQQWIKEAKRNGSYAFRNVASGRYLNVADRQSGASIIMANYRETWDSMLWYKETVGYTDNSSPNPPKDNTLPPVVETPGKADPKVQTSTHNYGEAFQLTPLFFAANQMGTLTDTRLPWRSNSNTDGSHSGGWGDAGDNIMFGKAQYRALASMCVTASFFKEELIEMGQYDEMILQITHGTNLLTNSANVQFDNSGNVTRLLAQISDRPSDHFYWRTIEESTHYRPIYFVDRNNKGSDYAGLAAAATGFCAEHFSGNYANTLRSHSQALYKFAKEYRGKGENSGVKSVYKNSNNDEDEIALGALGVYAATQNEQLLNEAHSIMDDNFLSPWAGGFEHQEHLVSTLLAVWGNRSDRRDQLKNYFNNWKNAGSELKTTGAGYILHDSNNWGSMGSIAPALMNMSIYAKATGDTSWDAHIKSQIDYNLGSNPRNLSYLCGYKTDSNCSRVHHRNATGGSKYKEGQDGNNMLWGAILDGVTENDYDQKNEVKQVQGNEPTVGYNAEFQAPLIYMYSLYGGAPISDTALRNRLQNWNGFK